MSRLFTHQAKERHSGLKVPRDQAHSPRATAGPICEIVEVSTYFGVWVVNITKHIFCLTQGAGRPTEWIPYHTVRFAVPVVYSGSRKKKQIKQTCLLTCRNFPQLVFWDSCRKVQAIITVMDLFTVAA